MNNNISLYWMYPDMLNLHGDKANILALGKIAERLGCTLNITKITSVKEEIDFENADMLLFSPGELRVIRKLIERLAVDIKKIEDFIISGKYILAIGTTGSLFSKEIKTVNNETIKGLDLLEMYCTERKRIIGDDIYFSIDENGQEIIGSQISTLNFEVMEGHRLGEIKYGFGNNGAGAEGARAKNLIFTNALGPVFVKNPWWAEAIITDIAKKKRYEINEIPIEEYELEVRSYKAIKEFIEKK
ncbi:MAG: hypothetical protein FWF46_07940 [Oscillospiraceae bacterium]|nr:hypothetical protein [Oscillospiraceae bacterium]